MAICINERHLASFASVREVEILAPLVREAGFVSRKITTGRSFAA